MRIIFSDARFNQWYVDAGDTTDKHMAKGVVEWIDCTDAEPAEQDSGSVWSKKIDLRFVRGATKVVEGMVQPVESGELKVSGDGKSVSRVCGTKMVINRLFAVIFSFRF